MLLTDPTAYDDQIRTEMAVYPLQILIQPASPFFPAPAFVFTHTGGSPSLCILATDFNMSQLGIGDEISINKQCRTNACAQGHEQDHTVLALPGPKTHL